MTLSPVSSSNHERCTSALAHIRKRTRDLSDGRISLQCSKTAGLRALRRHIHSGHDTPNDQITVANKFLLESKALL